MRTSLRVVIGLAVTGAVLAVTSVGTTWAHYSSTPGFREWARSHPAGDEVWQSRAPAGEVIARELPWRSNEGPASERRGQWRPHVTIEHGDEVLLDLELDVSIESCEVVDWEERGVPSEAFEAISVSTRRSQLDADFHAVAVLTLNGFSRFEAGEPEPVRPQGPEIDLDVFVLSGSGDVEVFVQDFEVGTASQNPPLLDGGHFEQPGPWPLSSLGVLRDVVFADDPPAEGIAYQVRTRFYANWTKTQGGSTSGGVGTWKFAGTTGLYSARLSGVQATRTPMSTPDHFSFSTSADSARFFTWNNQVW